MKILKITIFSNALHAEQVLTGFRILEKSGIIQIKHIEFDSSLITGKRNFYGQPFIKVELEESKILFDCSDTLELPSANWIHEQNITHYFKRSFKKEAYGDTPFFIYPLGFNYLVYVNQNIRLKMAQFKAALYQNNTLHYLASRNVFVSKLFRINNSINNCHIYKSSCFYGAPKKDIVLYSTRLWNPQNARSEHEREKREILNARRIEVVEALSKNFKRYFVGGIFNDEFSINKVPKGLLIERYYRSDYTKMLREAKVGLSINGHHSAGWAIGEYCAFGLGVICDPITVRVPGNFLAGSNYLEVINGEQAVEAVDKLLINQNNILNNIVNNNHKYYFNFLSPEKLILNALLTTIEIS